MPGKIHFFCALSPYFPLTGISFQQEPLSLAFNFPTALMVLLTAGAAVAALLFLPFASSVLPPGRQQEELGHASAATAQRKNVCVSISPRSTGRRRQRQRRWGKAGSLYQQLCCTSLTYYKGAGHLHLSTQFMSSLSL